MLRLFKQSDTVFTTNGDLVMMPTKAKVHRTQDEYYLDIELSIDYINDIAEDKIVVAETNKGSQAFRVKNITKTGKKISAKCPHVFFDGKNHFFVGAVGNRSGTLTTVMTYINGQVKPSSPFVFSSNITSSGYTWAWYESLYDVVVRAAERYGGYIRPSNYNVAITSSIGYDNGVVIQYGKNLKDISCEEDWSEVCTRIYPFGADGITVAETAVGLDNPYIDSSTQYNMKYIKSVEFDQSSISRDSYPSETAYKQALVTDLISKANAYLADHALPQVTYSIKANVEKITDIGDTIVVIDERLGVELETHVTAYDYDCLTGLFSEITFGNYTRTAKGMGLTVSKVSDNQANGILADRRLLFKSDNSIKWELITPPMT